MINVILILLIALIALGGVRSLIKRANGESCCSGGASEIAVEPADKNKKPYPLKAKVTIDGMKCRNCAARIQNRLNENGMWARVNFSKKTAVVLAKETDAETKIKKIIQDAGYRVTAYEEAR